MIGADLLILLFGVGVCALTWVVGRAALEAASSGVRNRAIVAAVAAAVLGLIGAFAVLEGLARLFLR
jgi:hypothetical protein